jgi:hypothetical protein
MFSGERRRSAPAFAGKHAIVTSGLHLVGVPGFEPGASSLSGTRSNQLSYTPNLLSLPPGVHPHSHRRNVLVEATGFEPVTPSLQSSCSTN